MNVLIAMTPEWGAMMPSVPLARELSKRGHRIVFCGPNASSNLLTHAEPERLRHFVERQGFVYSDYLAAAHHSNGHGGPKVSGFWSRIHEDVVRILQTHAIDLLLADPLMSSAVLAGVRQSVFTVLLRPNVAARINLRVPPFSSSAIPDHQSFARGEVCREWIRHVIDWNRQTSNRLEHALRTFGAAIRFRLPVHYTDLGLTLGLQTLYLYPRVFDFIQYPSRTYVGTIDAARDEPDYHFPETPEGAPLIFCSLGTNSHTLPNSVNFFRVLVQAFEARPRYRAIVQIGSACRKEDLGPVPKNVCLESWVPQLAVLEKASLMITAGGLGSIKEAIFSLTPLILFPGGYDQPGNAARAVFHGLGLRGDVESITPLALAQMIDQVLGAHSTYVTRLAAMRPEVARDADVISAVDKLERWHHGGRGTKRAAVPVHC
jgi:UDP:flavonoid glycosyltransferase YjiC (YdhE family)